MMAAVIVLGTTLSVRASAVYSKDEVVYVNLAHNGDVDAIYVVNSFEMPSGGVISDYGAYSEVVNLTTTEPIHHDGSFVSVNASAGKFYYEGVLEKKEIPWRISVRYNLDGKPMDGSNLAGQSGRLQIDVGIRLNKEVAGIWRDHYAIQASLSLGSESCVNISAPDATIAVVGDQKQLSYIILPGKEKDFTITADVTDFKMSGISFNMVPLSLSIDEPDTAEIKDKLFELQDGAVELDNGAVDLMDGAQRLDDGAGKLDDGVTRLRDGVTELTDGVNELTDGVNELRDGANDLRDGAGDMLNGTRDVKKGVNRLIDGAVELESGAVSFAGGLSQLDSQSVHLIEGSAQIRAGLGQAAEAVSGMDAEGIAELQGQASQLKDASQSYLDALDALIVMYEDQQLSYYSIGYSGNPEETYAEEMDDDSPDEADADEETDIIKMDNGNLVEAYADEIDYDNTSAEAYLLEQTITALKELRGNYLRINGGIEQVTEAVTQQSGKLPGLADGVKALSDQYGQLDMGINVYTQGVGQLSVGFQELAGGIYTLSDGIEKLDDGAGELRSGARDLYDGTYDLQDGVRKLADGTIALDDGTIELKDGAMELKDGTVELKEGTVELADGTGELRTKTAGMDAEVDSKIDEMIDSYRSKDFVRSSFVDESNQNVGSVQFVMKTAEISIEDKVEDVRQEEPAPTLWQRFLNLFSFLWKEND
jgi:putative membrane protein